MVDQTLTCNPCTRESATGWTQDDLLNKTCETLSRHSCLAIKSRNICPMSSSILREKKHFQYRRLQLPDEVHFFVFCFVFSYNPDHCWLANIQWEVVDWPQHSQEACLHHYLELFVMVDQILTCNSCIRESATDWTQDDLLNTTCEALSRHRCLAIKSRNFCPMSSTFLGEQKHFQYRRLKLRSEVHLLAFCFVFSYKPDQCWLAI